MSQLILENDQTKSYSSLVLCLQLTPTGWSRDVNLHAGCIKTCFDFAYLTLNNLDWSENVLEKVKNISFLNRPKKHVKFHARVPLSVYVS